MIFKPGDIVRFTNTREHLRLLEGEIGKDYKVKSTITSGLTQYVFLENLAGKYFSHRFILMRRGRPQWEV